MQVNDLFNALQNNMDKNNKTKVETDAPVGTNSSTDSIVSSISNPMDSAHNTSTSQNITSFAQRLYEIAQDYPNNLALVDDEQSMTYKDTVLYSAKIAHCISKHCVNNYFSENCLSEDINAKKTSTQVKQPCVAVMCDKNIYFILASLGILQSSAIYVPLDPALPLQRRRDILQDCQAKLLICDINNTKDAQKLQMSNPSLDLLLCLGAENFEDAIEKPGELMNLDLWQHVTKEKADGSWKSYYDGKPIASEHLESMASNIYKKVSHALSPTAHVLDIGGGSGIVAQKIIKSCGQYTGVELAHHEFTRLSDLANTSQIPIFAYEMEALHINYLTSTYDLIIMNSVLENFPGHNYLRAVLDRALLLLNDDGTLFIGNVWDLNNRDAIVQDLRSYAEKHNNYMGLIRFENEQELLVPQNFFIDWQEQCGFTIDMEFSAPIEQFKTLNAHHYDVIIRKSSQKKTKPLPQCRFGDNYLNTFTAEVEASIKKIVSLNQDAIPDKANNVNNVSDIISLNTISAVSNTNHTKQDLPKGFFPTKNDAAYIIYTSGSTGKPKGVIIEHGSLINLMNVLLQEIYIPFQQLDANAKDTIKENKGKGKNSTEQTVNTALLASFSFDASLQGLATLMGGHCLFPVSESIKQDPKALHAFLERRKIDVCDGTPSLFLLLLDHWEDNTVPMLTNVSTNVSTPITPRSCSNTNDSNACSNVKLWLLGGESLHNTHLQRFYSLEGHENSKIINAYGPTEACVDSSLHTFDAQTWHTYVSPPLGKPIAHVHFSICDAEGKLMPQGIPGELWISGINLAKGYHNEPELTAKYFLEKDGIRYYRTGDIVYKKKDLYFYSGREDTQIKIAGYRIETGEVEAMLSHAPMVQTAVVEAGYYSSPSIRTLAAYIIPAKQNQKNISTASTENNSDTKLDINALRSYLSNHLPAYAIPSYFICMDTLPMTTSGKIDRKSLPSPLSIQQISAGRPLEGKTEILLGKLWSTLLGRDIKNAEMDFFELGGHSILGIRLISLIEKHFAQRLSISILFKAPTIELLANILDTKKQMNPFNEQQTSVIPIEVDKNKKAIILFHPVGGSIYCYRALAQKLSHSYSVYGVEQALFHSRWASMHTVEDMVAQYKNEILQVLEDSHKGQDFIIGGWSFGGILATEAMKQLAKMGKQAQAVVLLDSCGDNRTAKQLLLEDESQFIAQIFSGSHPLDANMLRTMNTEERLEYILNYARLHKALPESFSKDDMRILLQTYHFNALALARFTIPQIHIETLLIRAKQYDASWLSQDTENMGWKESKLGALHLEWVEGNHGSLLHDQNVQEVADAILKFCKHSRINF